MQQRNGSGYTRYEAPSRKAPFTPEARQRPPEDASGGAEAATPARTGKSYDVVEVTTREDGSKQYTNRGLVFVRDSGTGGVAYLKLGGPGDRVELALFPKRKRE